VEIHSLETVTITPDILREKANCLTPEDLSSITLAVFPLFVDGKLVTGEE
jgi:hypothetical protein